MTKPDPNANIGLAYAAAKMIARRARIEVSDIFSLCYIHLHGACERHDPAKGRISTYATKRIWFKAYADHVRENGGRRLGRSVGNGGHFVYEDTYRRPFHRTLDRNAAPTDERERDSRMQIDDLVSLVGLHLGRNHADLLRAYVEHGCSMLAATTSLGYSHAKGRDMMRKIRGVLAREYKHELTRIIA